MKKFICDYVSFNAWATNIICNVVETLSDEQFNREVKSSFPSIRETLLHVRDSQDIWLKRFDGISPKEWPSFNGTREELTAALRKSCDALEEKVFSYDKKQLKQEVAYTTLKGISGNSPRYQMFAHVVNHGTYHRGQLVTMFREVGVTEIPGTDLITFFREQVSVKTRKK